MRFRSPPSASNARANSEGKASAAVDLIYPRRRIVVFAVVSTVGCAADLLTKQSVFQWRGLPRPHNEWWLWEPYIGVETAVNVGALFGMGAGFGYVFAVLSIAAAIGIVIWLFGYGAASDRWLTIALSLVMGGIIGNLYDRLGLWWNPEMPPEWRSGVRDWILFRYGNFTWPNFNIADSLLVSGAVMLLIHAFLLEQKPASSDRSANQKAT